MNLEAGEHLERPDEIIIQRRATARTVATACPQHGVLGIERSTLSGSSVPSAVAHDAAAAATSSFGPADAAGPETGE